MPLLTVAPEAPASSVVRDEAADAARRRRGVATALVVDEHRLELHRLTDDLARLSASTQAVGSLVGELSADLGREFDRLRATSAAWVQGPSPSGDAHDAGSAPAAHPATAAADRPRSA